MDGEAGVGIDEGTHGGTAVRTPSAGWHFFLVLEDGKDIHEEERVMDQDDAAWHAASLIDGRGRSAVTWVFPGRKGEGGKAILRARSAT